MSKKIQESNGPIPIFRSFNETACKKFYIDFLGFTLDWEHRFEKGTPLYMQLSYKTCLLHVSEHYGDSSPGSHIRIHVPDVADYAKQLNDKKYRFSRPGCQEMPWGTIDMTINDPSGNRVTFYSRK